MTEVKTQARRRFSERLIRILGHDIAQGYVPCELRCGREQSRGDARRQSRRQAFSPTVMPPSVRSATVHAQARVGACVMNLSATPPPASRDRTVVSQLAPIGVEGGAIRITSAYQRAVAAGASRHRRGSASTVASDACSV